MKPRTIVLAVLVAVAAVAGIGVWTLTHLTWKDSGLGPAPSEAQQHKQFCGDTAAAAIQATPAKLLGGSGAVSIKFGQAAELYKTPTLFGNRFMPKELRADYAKFLAELQRRQEPGATGRRDDAAVARVDVAVRKCRAA